MKKYVLVTIILLASLISLRASASYVTAICSIKIHITDPTWGGETYSLLLEVISPYSDTYSNQWYITTGPNDYNYSAIQVPNVWYQTPTTENFYTMRLWMKRGSGSWQYRDSYGGFTVVGGIYYLTAFDDYYFHF